MFIVLFIICLVSYWFLLRVFMVFKPLCSYLFISPSSF